jgi:hypothetical protein
MANFVSRRAYQEISTDNDLKVPPFGQDDEIHYQAAIGTPSQEPKLQDVSHISASPAVGQKRRVGRHCGPSRKTQVKIAKHARMTDARDKSVEPQVEAYAVVPTVPAGSPVSELPSELDRENPKPKRDAAALEKIKVWLQKTHDNIHRKMRTEIHEKINQEITQEMTKAAAEMKNFVERTVEVTVTNKFAAKEVENIDVNKLAAVVQHMETSQAQIIRAEVQTQIAPVLAYSELLGKMANQIMAVVVEAHATGRFALQQSCREAVLAEN